MLGNVNFMKYIFCLSLLFCPLAHSSCTELFEGNGITIRKKPFNSTELEVIKIGYPKEIQGKLFESISFNYQYSGHYVSGNLAYKESSTGYESELIYQNKYSKAVELNIVYKLPDSECKIVYSYRGSKDS
jgi:hypothetical protein